MNVSQLYEYLEKKWSLKLVKSTPFYTP
jgi:hypothetical protein